MNKLTIETSQDNDVDSDDDTMYNAKYCCEQDIKEVNEAFQNGKLREHVNNCEIDRRV